MNVVNDVSVLEGEMVEVVVDRVDIVKRGDSR